jgi:hypothetical protein
MTPGNSTGAATVRVVYVKEGDVWWATASMPFSAAADTLPELRTQVKKAMAEVLPGVAVIEVINSEYL